MVSTESQSHSASHHTGSFETRKLSWVGPLTIVTATLVNLGIRALSVALFGVPEHFTLLQPLAIVSSTMVFLALAVAVFFIVGRFSRRPARVYRILALIALLVSYLNPIMALTQLFPAPGMNVNIFWTMIALHTVTASITVAMLTRLTRES